jgi:hypothetical protein
MQWTTGTRTERAYCCGNGGPPRRKRTIPPCPKLSGVAATASQPEQRGASVSREVDWIDDLADQSDQPLGSRPGKSLGSLTLGGKGDGRSHRSNHSQQKDRKQQQRECLQQAFQRSSQCDDRVHRSVPFLYTGHFRPTRSLPARLICIYPQESFATLNSTFRRRANIPALHRSRVAENSQKKGRRAA